MARQGYTLKTKDGLHQVALFPPQELNITQGAGGSYSHANTLNTDNAVRDASLRMNSAPFDCVVVRNYYSSGYGIVIWHSEKPVMTPRGLSHVTLVGMHDNYANRWSVGSRYKQGQAFYEEGDADPSGLTTGIHSHWETALGHETIRDETASGRSQIRNAKRIDEVFYANGMIGGWNEIPLAWTNSQRTHFKEYDGSGGGGNNATPKRTISIIKDANTGGIKVSDIYKVTKDTGNELILEKVVTETQPQKNVELFPQTGSFTFNRDSHIMSQPDYMSTKLDTYHKGQTVNYEGWCRGDGHLWLYYTKDGQTRYVAYSRNVAGSEDFGTFK